MVKINRQQVSLATQALHTMAKASPENTGILLKLSTTKVNPQPLLKVSAPCKKNCPQLEKIKKNGFHAPPLATIALRKITKNIDDYQLGKGQIKSLAALCSAPHLDQPSTFRLAEEIGKRFPPIAGHTLNNIDRLVIFGDSLSDSQGRMYDKSLHILPSYGQYHEGRFTNGFVWGEYLSSPAFLNKTLVNYAEGGSTSASYSPLNLKADFLSNLDAQAHSYAPSTKDLAIFFLGSNDYIVLHEDNIIKVIKQQINDIEKILNKGVDKILVMGIPDLSLTPQSRATGDSRQLKDISFAHNSLLQHNIDELKSKYPTKKIYYFDTSSVFKEILKVADDIGYNTTQPYTHHGYIHIPTTDDPVLNIAPAYLFNDSVHPTQEVHHSFASILANFIIKHYRDIPDTTGVSHPVGQQNKVSTPTALEESV